MYQLQLGDNLFVTIGVGDIFIYRYSHNHSAIEYVKADYRPPLNEYTVEILSFYSKKHFILIRQNNYYWWQEIRY